MKKSEEDAICSNCEWTGDATGITSCPVCGSDLSSLNSSEEDLTTPEQEKYPKEFLARVNEADDDYLE